MLVLGATFFIKWSFGRSYIWRFWLWEGLGYSTFNLVVATSIGGSNCNQPWPCQPLKPKVVYCWKLQNTLYIWEDFYKNLCGDMFICLVIDLQSIIYIILHAKKNIILHHFIREQVEVSEVNVNYVLTIM
jgi:hypothetical protein